MSYDADEVRQHAKIAAHYFQALLIEGVGTDAAIQMTSSYVTFAVISARQSKAAAAGEAP